MKEIVITKQEYSVLCNALVRRKDAIELAISAFDLYNCTYEDLVKQHKLFEELKTIHSLLGVMGYASLYDKECKITCACGKGDCENVQK